LAFAQAADMLSEQRRVHRIGMVEIQLDSFGEGQFGKALVVIILLEHDDIFLRKRLDDAAGDSRLAGASASADPDDQRARVECSNGRCS
jgi:hypothetical protein